MPIDKSSVIFVDREFKATSVEDVFLKYRAELIAELRESIIRVGKDQPGELLQSVDGVVQIVANGVTFEIKMLDYWDVVDKGVDGYEKSVGSAYKYKKNTKRIPIDAMKKFIAARGIRPAMSIKAHRKSETFSDKRIKARSKKVNKENELNSLAFAIGASIKKKGLKPTHFFTDVINLDLKARLTADITKALGKDIELHFTI